ncbi:MAG TPA: dihydrofolate reductase family protein [Thermodesulfobacteriota bacterium]|nr:dihydrofolate reductase family protein [Thermodesulfobacteriota bacterium]
MRKVVVSNLVSLDGFIAGPSGEIDWFSVGGDFMDYTKERLGSMGILLFGRVTYELMAGYWPDASPAENDEAIIHAMNGLPKIVFSRTLASVEWNNAVVNRGDPVHETERMKAEGGKDIVIFGSGTMVSALSAAGLVDEYRIFVNPVILGAGKTQFGGVGHRVGLRLKETKAFAGGLVLLTYTRD